MNYIAQSTFIHIATPVYYGCETNSCPNPMHFWECGLCGSKVHYGVSHFCAYSIPQRFQVNAYHDI